MNYSPFSTQLRDVCVFSSSWVPKPWEVWLHWLVVFEDGPYSPDGSQKCCECVWGDSPLKRTRRSLTSLSSALILIVALPFGGRSQSLAEVVPVGGFISKLVMSGCFLIHLLHKTVHRWTAGMWRPLSEPFAKEKHKYSSLHEAAPLHLTLMSIYAFFKLIWPTSIIHVLSLNMQHLILLFYNFKHRK